MDECRSETPLAPQQQESPAYVHAHQTERRERRLLDFKLLPARITAQGLTKAFEDDKRSVTSGQSLTPYSPTLCFQANG